MRRSNPVRDVRVLVRRVSLTLLLVATGVAVLAQEDAGARYIEALEARSAGDLERSVAVLAQLAEENRASIPVHLALARVAIEAGDDTRKEWRSRFWRRLRRTRRDVGACAGRALILEHENRVAEAHNLLLSAITSGARHPSLAPLLLRTTREPRGLASWLGRRAAVLGRDPAFAALRVRYLEEAGLHDQAGEVLRAAIERYGQDGEILSLAARWSLADGDGETAAHQAALAAGVLAREEAIPDVRVPRRLDLARALLAGGRLGEARRVLLSLGPLASLEGSSLFESGLAIVEAELALANQDAAQALALMPEIVGLTGDWREAGRAVRSRAFMALGLADDPTPILEAPVPRGRRAADRLVALGALAAAGSAAPTDIADQVEQVAAELEATGLLERACRAWLLAAFLRGAGAEGESALGQAERLAEEPQRSQTRALAAVASHLIRAGWAAAAGNRERVLGEAGVSHKARAGAPGRVMAELRLLAARAALELDDPQRALQLVRDGLLDLQEADMSRVETPLELRVIETHAGDPATCLPGIAFAAELASGRSPRDAGATLLRELARAARSWSTEATLWPSQPSGFSELLGPDGCLVVATPEPSAPALAVSPSGVASVAPIDEVLSRRPCRAACAIVWLGSAAAPGGLTPGPNDERLLVRLVPTDAPPADPATVDAIELRGVGPGPERPLRTTVETLVGKREAVPQGISGAVAQLDETWPIFHGAGIASTQMPLASGWLVPEGMVPRGWLGAEDVPSSAPLNGTGLVALGLRAEPRGRELEKGAWLLAETALATGRPWALLSRRALSEEERQRLVANLADWHEDAPRAAAELVRSDPELAERLSLWITPWGATIPPCPVPWWRWALLLTALIAGGVLIYALRRWRGAGAIR